MAAIFFVITTVKAQFDERERGATAVEYGIMVAGIAVLIIAAVFLVGGELNTLFGKVVTALQRTV